MVERFNQTIQTMLVKYIQEKKETWEDYIDTCIYAYNTAQHESTKFTPFELTFSRKPVLPIDMDRNAPEQIQEFTEIAEGLFNLLTILLLYEYCMYSIFYSDQITFNLEERATTLEKAKANILIAQSRQKKAYDQRHSNPYVFQIGGLVLKKDFKRKKRKGGKLDPKWVGPDTIIGNLGHGL